MADEAAAGTGPIVHAIKGTEGKPERVYAFRSVKVLGYAVSVAGALYALSSLALIGVLWLAEQGDPLATPTETMTTSAALVSLVVLVNLLTSYVLAGFWIYNAACNARAFGAKGLQVSPGWAVGFYAVPIMSLFKPFQAMEEIWDASAGSAPLRTPMLMRWWWAAWLISNFTGTIIARIQETPTVFRMADAALDAVAASLFVTIVWRVTRMQMSRHSDIAQVFS